MYGKAHSKLLKKKSTCWVNIFLSSILNTTKTQMLPEIISQHTLRKYVVSLQKIDFIETSLDAVEF